MASTHPAPGELIDVLGTGPIAPERSRTLVRTEHLQIFRYALPAGKVVDTHAASGLMVVHCLEGDVDFGARGEVRRLTPGTMLYLPDGELHALTAVTDALLLITIILNRV